VLLVDRQRPAEALPAYERAIAADPELADAHYNLALLYEHAGRKQEAVRHFAIYRKLGVSARSDAVADRQVITHRRQCR
jgi:tetratricopeptide (TPR) repeat protein